MKFDIISRRNRAFWGKVAGYMSAFVVGVTVMSVIFHWLLFVRKKSDNVSLFLLCQKIYYFV